MQSVHFPGEEEIKKWVREVIKEELHLLIGDLRKIPTVEDEPLLTRQEIADYLRISLVTLHKRVKRGMPRHKDKGRVVFYLSEVKHWQKENEEEEYS